MIVPKDLVTEPLDAEWVMSKINLPSPDTVASYRRGQYHAHETEVSYNVHLDRVDPATHPFMHLVDDAPLVLMISSVFSTTIADARTARRGERRERLKEQSRAWKRSLGIGSILIAIGVLLFVKPLAGFNLVLFLIPLAVICFGLFMILDGRNQDGGKVRIWQGLAAVTIGLIMFFLLDFVVLLILLFLALWLFLSGYFSLRRGLRRKKVPDGSWIPITIGLLSLILAVLLLVSPSSAIVIFVWVAATMVILVGLVQVNNAMIMRGALKEMMERAA